mmetsp:Transcript_340/g.1365  ORF Transcript_340/g.1365 Transcript_340/m.1365 type:complete len:319 (+) Transcript_340:656-1612(+)
MGYSLRRREVRRRARRLLLLILRDDPRGRRDQKTNRREPRPRQGVRRAELDPGGGERARPDLPRHVLLVRHRRAGVPAGGEQRVRDAARRRVHRVLRLLLRRHVEQRARGAVQKDAAAHHHGRRGEARDERRGDDARVSRERGGRVRRRVRLLVRGLVRARRHRQRRARAQVCRAVAGARHRPGRRRRGLAHGFVARGDDPVQRVLLGAATDGEQAGAHRDEGERAELSQQQRRQLCHCVALRADAVLRDDLRGHSQVKVRGLVWFGLVRGVKSITRRRVVVVVVVNRTEVLSQLAAAERAPLRLARLGRVESPRAPG